MINFNWPFERASFLWYRKLSQWWKTSHLGITDFRYMIWSWKSLQLNSLARDSSWLRRQLCHMTSVYSTDQNKAPQIVYVEYREYANSLFTLKISQAYAFGMPFSPSPILFLHLVFSWKNHFYCRNRKIT